MSAPEKRSLRERLRPKERKPAVRWLLTVLLLAAAVLGLHMLLQMIGTLDFSRGRFSSYLHVPKIYLLNLLPVALLVAFTYFATNRAWLGFLIPSVLLFVMDFVNYFKVTLRGDPFVAEDFLTIGEGAGIIGQYTLHFPAMFFVGIALIAAGTIVLHRWARGRVPKKRWWLRVLALVLIVLLGFGAWELWYGNTDLYDSMLEANTSLFNVWKDAENYASKGFVYSFLNSLAEAIPAKPDGYSARKAEDLLSAYPEADIPEGQRVNVIATMLESFSDLSMFDSVSERFVQDPYADFHALQAESYTGTLISDTIGGGTINAERAFLTGYSYPQPRYRRDTESFVRYFLEQGYETEGGHPGYAWFYSREKINERLSFETYHFLDGYYENLLTDENSLDGHPNDETFFAERAESWEARDPSKPCFSFSVSYQGHSPYADDTLVWGETYIPHEGISDAAYYTVNNYLGSVASTGKQLAAYVDSFRDDPEPVVLVFFGDHKPTLGAGNSFYEELGVNVQEGTAEGFYNLYTSPYLIWTNDAAKAVLGRSDIGTGPTISPCYLMSVLFDCCGWEGPSWMQLQRQTRAVLPVMQSRGMYLVAQGSAPTASQGIALLTYTLSGDALQAKQNYAIAEYYVRRIRPTQS